MIPPRAGVHDHVRRGYGQGDFRGGVTRNRPLARGGAEKGNNYDAMGRRIGDAGRPRPS